MSTFRELQVRQSAAQYKKTILEAVMSYLDENFRPVAGGDPINALLTDEKVRVPDDAFEAFMTDVLVPLRTQTEAEIAAINDTSLAPVEASAPVQAVVAPAPAEQQAQPQPRRRRRIQEPTPTPAQ